MVSWKRRYNIKLIELGLVLSGTLRAVNLVRRNGVLFDGYDSKYIISIIEKIKKKCAGNGDTLKINARSIFGNVMSLAMIKALDNSPVTRRMSIEKSATEIDDLLETATKLNPDDLGAMPGEKLVSLEYFCKMLLELVDIERNKLRNVGYPVVSL